MKNAELIKTKKFHSQVIAQESKPASTSNNDNVTPLSELTSSYVNRQEQSP